MMIIFFIKVIHSITSNYFDTILYCFKNKCLIGIVSKSGCSIIDKLMLLARISTIKLNDLYYEVPENRNKECQQKSKSLLPPYERRLRELLENWQVYLDRNKQGYRSMRSPR